MEMNDLKTALKTLILSDDKAEQQTLLKNLKGTVLEKKTIRLHKNKVKSVKKLDNNNSGEYVYDIGMRNEEHPWFYANNMLVHNSIYFTAYPSLVNEISNGSIPWNKDTVVQLYDQIGDEVNSTFPEFMLLAFHCPKTRGEVIKAGREIVGTESLFITKKRYAVMYYDKDGKRYDTDGKSGKVKAMGLDLKRSDTPEFMQQFLSKLLNMVLTGASEVDVLDSIKEFRKEFKARPGWEKGSPKRANSITAYMKKLEENPKTTVPGHVRASINWNTLRRMYSDKYSSAITDGAKVIVCKLKPNPLGFTSVAFPVDEPRLPQWFKDLPFDHDEMENVIINNKLDNLIGVLNYDLESTLESNTFNSLFDF